MKKVLTISEITKGGYAPDPYIYRCAPAYHKLNQWGNPKDPFTDGDTVWLMIDYGFENYNERSIRLAVVDAAEKSDPDPHTKQQAYVAKDFVRDWFKQHGNAVNGRFPFWMRSLKDRTGRYGRYVAFIFNHDLTSCLNQELVKAGLAIEKYGSLADEI